jgi:hypothetical protein
MNNFKGYRSYIKALDPPIIPCLGKREYEWEGRLGKGGNREREG